MGKIAIMYICTGKYEMFWEQFYNCIEEYFYPDCEKEYYVFTDSQEIIKGDKKNVYPFYQVKTGWPYDTLLRFQWFMTVQDRIEKCNYCYYFNANTVIYKTISEEIIPFPYGEKPLVFWCHTNHFEDSYGNNFHPERNPESTAYVKEGDWCRCYGGGFFGGISSAFINMCQELRDNIEKDLQKGIIAVWHDQSHIIKYATKHDHIEVAYGVISEEEYIPDKNNVHMVFLAKSSYGGNDVLRDSDIKLRIRNMPKMIYARLLKLLNKVGLDEALRMIVHKIKK